MELKNTGYSEGARAALLCLPRFSVLRNMLEGAPMPPFRAMLEALLEHDAYAACEQYHIMSHAMLTGGYRRASGDLFHDYLLHSLLEEENAFSRLAAKSVWDEALSAAMRADLNLTDALFAINSATIKKWIGECAKAGKQRPKSKPDNISAMSSAVWTGGAPKPLSSSGDKAAEQKTAPGISLGEEGFISWRYRFEPVYDEYVADSVLEELYRRFLNSNDRGMLLDDLWNFHSSCGTGAFVRHRLFMIDFDGALKPMRLGAEPYNFGLYADKRELAVKNAVRFMQGEHSDNMLFMGGPGTGKTTQVFALYRELPELRLILCPPGRLSALASVIGELLDQPYKFMLLLDDFDSKDAGWPMLRCMLAPGGIQHGNITVVACARKADDPFFPLKLQLEALELKEFTGLVRQILESKGGQADHERIQNACIDYAAAAGNSGGSPLSFRSAGLIAQTLEQN